MGRDSLPVIPGPSSRRLDNHGLEGRATVRALAVKFQVVLGPAHSRSGSEADVFLDPLPGLESVRLTVAGDMTTELG